MFNLRRITRDGRWLKEIDGLRFVAISAVFLFHLSIELTQRSGRLIGIEPQWEWLERLIGNAGRGVDLFFVISGMILALPFARQMLADAKPVSLRKYYLRRVTRLEPPYMLSLFLALVMVGVWQRSMLPRAPEILASLFYQHSLVYGVIGKWDPVTWSLEVEIQFYAIAPLLMQVFRLQKVLLRRGLMLALMLLIGLAQAPFSVVPRLELSVLFYLQYFLAGLLVADVFVTEQDCSSRGWDAAGVCGFILLFWPHYQSFWAHVTGPFAGAALCLAALRGRAIRWVLQRRWIAITGGMCYSIYLMHFLLTAAIFKVTRRAIVPGASYAENLGIQVFVTGLPALLCCVVFYVLIERPCMDPDWPSKLWHWFTGRSGGEVEEFDSAGISGN